jgi:phosphoribosylglycinamide formyltransferase-1
MDEGPILAQAAVPVLPDDTEDTLAARVLVQEHVMYPLALRLFASRQTGTVPPDDAALLSPMPAEAALRNPLPTAAVPDRLLPPGAAVP